jgi:hypothetical protein
MDKPKRLNTKKIIDAINRSLKTLTDKFDKQSVKSLVLESAASEKENAKSHLDVQQIINISSQSSFNSNCTVKKILNEIGTDEITLISRYSSLRKRCGAKEKYLNLRAEELQKLRMKKNVKRPKKYLFNQKIVIKKKKKKNRIRTIKQMLPVIRHSAKTCALWHSLKAF